MSEIINLEDLRSHPSPSPSYDDLPPLEDVVTEILNMPSTPAHSQSYHCAAACHTVTEEKPVVARPQAASLVRDIVIDPATGRGSELCFATVAAAASHLKQKGGGAVVFVKAPKGLHDTETDPTLNYRHLLKPEHRDALAVLQAEFSECTRKGEYAQAKKMMRAMSKRAPGLCHCDMVNSYTTAQHLTVQAMPETMELMDLMHGKKWRWLHNRGAVRLSPIPRTPLRVADAMLHKEGDENDLGVICCLKGRRFITLMPKEHTKPMAPPGMKNFRKVSMDELVDPEAHEVVALDVRVPVDCVAFILFANGHVHGVDPRGQSADLYISAANDEAIEKLHAKRRQILNGKTYVNSHDQRMRDKGMHYYDTVQIAWLLGTCDQLWPSGKVIPAHGSDGQSFAGNKRKYVDERICYKFPDTGTVEHGAEVQARLESKGIHVPALAYSMPEKWMRSPEILSSEQLMRWGFTRE